MSVFLLTCIAFCLYMLYRNERVCRYRIWVLNESHSDLGVRLNLHHQLPDYNKMVLQLFRFDWSDYLDYESATSHS